MRKNVMRFVSLGLVVMLSFGVLMGSSFEVFADTQDVTVQDTIESDSTQDYDVSETLEQVDAILDQTQKTVDTVTPIVTIDPTVPVASTTTTTSKKKKTTGKDVVAYAKKFVGNKYKWGGTSLTKGTDCSGFTQSVYKHFGYKIPRTSSAQRKAGKGVKVSNRKAGDLICYSGHVALYIGNNKIVHASNSKPYPKGGIKISKYNYRKIKAVRRIIK